jgi:hypothetical protein
MVDNEWPLSTIGNEREAAQFKGGVTYDAVKHLLSTKYDFTSIMDVIGIKPIESMFEDLYLTSSQTEAELRSLLNNNTKLIPVAHELSEYDQANISLLYPGKNLLLPLPSAGTAAGIGKSTSTSIQDSTRNTISRIRHYCALLDLEHVAESLEAAAMQADWPQVRDGYQKAMQASMKAIWDIRSAKLDNKKSGRAHFPHRALEPVSGPTPSRPFKDILYDKLDALFGPTGNQYFALQLPTRYLDKNTFAYKATGIYSNFTKPSMLPSETSRSLVLTSSSSRRERSGIPPD